MSKVLYPASFDPITYGHINIAERAATLFDEVVVAVFDKPAKSLLFSPQAREQMVKEALLHLKNVQILPYHGLTVNFAQSIGATSIVRGLRLVSDFEYEMQLASANKSLAPAIETICLMSSPEFNFVSSSIVKDIALNRGQVEHLVPPHVATALQAHYKR